MATKKKPVYLSFQDCETDEDGLYGRAICAQYNLFHVEHANKRFRDEEQLRNILIETSYTTGYECYIELFKHLLKIVDTHSNGRECTLYLVYFNASFDIQRMIEGLPDSEFHIQLIHSKSLVTEIKFAEYPNISIEVRDLMLISPTSLATFTSSFAPNIKKLKRAVSFDIKPFDVDDPSDIEYALRDVDSMTEAYFNAALELGFDFDRPPLTTPSLAMRKQSEFYREEFGHEWVGLSREENEKHKKYCHGGRNLIGCGLELNREIPCAAMDIVSAYVAVMAYDYYPMAAQKPLYLKTLPKRRNLKTRFLVSLYIEHYHPPHYSMLPNEKGIFAAGTFTTHITDNEYYTLIKYHKKYFKRLQILEVFLWDSSKCAKTMRRYSENYYAVKTTGDEMNKLVPGSGDSKRAVGKLLGNSFYGKMIQRYYNDIEIFVTARDKETTSFTREERPSETFTDKRFYAVGAFITGAIRTELYKCIEHYGSEHLINGDTDSLKFRKEAFINKKPYTKIGKELGNFKFEYIGDDTRIIVHAPKCYVMLYSEKGQPKRTIVVKGIVRRNSIQGDKQLDNDLHRSMVNGSILTVQYKKTANTLKRYLQDKQLGYTLVRELTRRENVVSYVWNSEKTCYDLPILNEPLTIN